MSRRVGVLMGGLSSERAISLKSGQAVAAALRERGHEVVELLVDRDLARRLVEHPIDVAWIALHGRFGEDGCVQGMLEVLGVPYTGSGVLASAVCMDKAATKRALRGVSEVSLAADRVLHRGEVVSDCPAPCVIKPAVGGSTLGIVKVDAPDAVDSAVFEALKLDPVVLVEEFIEGPEITVAVLDGRALPVIGIVPQSGFFDFKAKYQKGATRYEVPSTLPSPVTARAQEAAEAAYRTLGCRGLARADFIVRADGVPIFLEINTLPGMTPTSLSPMAASLTGMTFADLCESVLETAQCMPEEPEMT
jgi:D-alanine-D-alanine ligase